MYYTYTVPSYMDSLTNNLKNVLNNPDKFETFMNDNFRQYSWFYDKDNNIWRNHWLELLDRSQKYRDLFDHKVQLNYEGNEYKNLGRFSYTLSLMHEYHNNGGKTAWYAMPVMSNKPSSEFIKFLKYTDPDSYKETLTNLFMDSVYQEIERIKTVITRATLDDIKSIKNWDVKGPNDKWISRYNKGRLTAKDLANFKGNGAKFHFMSFLNDEIQDGTPLGKMVLNMINGKEIDSDKFLVSFSERFNSWMDDIVDSSI